MKNLSRAYKQFIITTCISSAVLFFYLSSSNLLPRLQFLEQDLYYSLRGPLAPGNDIVIAAIDEKSIDHLGRWPWNREIVARLVDSLSDYGASVIGLDIVFSSSETDRAPTYLHRIYPLLDELKDRAILEEIALDGIRLTDHDRVLYDAIHKAQNVVLGYFFHFSRQGLEHLSEKQLEDYFDIIAFSRFTRVRKSSDANLLHLPLRKAFAVESTISQIAEGAIQMGYFNFAPAEDGSIRTLPLIVQYRDMVELKEDGHYLFPPLSLNLLNEYLQTNTLIEIDSYGVNRVALVGEESDILPVNNLGEMWINYYGPKKTFPHISAVDLINKQIEPEKLKGKIVVVGATATAIEDQHATPFDKQYPGVEIHATIMDNILSKRILSEPFITTKALNIIGIVLLGFLLFIAVPHLSAIKIGALYLIGAVGLVWLNYVLFCKYLLVVTAVPMLLELSGVTFALYIHRFIMEEKEKRYILNAFGKYLSPVVITEIIKHPAQLCLGGEKRQMTAFFSDIEGFTALSEKLSPEELVGLLNKYLTEMTAIILKYNGTVDKYEGDTIVAFFGAPLEVSDHALQCCLMALDMEKRLEEINMKWRLERKPELKVRMGINTGQMVVGNMGSSFRMDYTIMGDAVNLASRLEGANKVYQTTIMISETTIQECRNQLEVRELDVIRVVGKREAVKVYELLSRINELSVEKQELIHVYNRGLKMYRQNKWQEGFEIFNKICVTYKKDGPSRVYRDRCQKYCTLPPEPDWDGVFTLSSK